MPNASIDPYSKQPVFQQLAELLMERRRNHEKLLPPFRTLCREYGVSLNVTQRAIKLLCDQGYLVVRQNVGCQWVDGQTLPPAVRKLGYIHAYAPDRDRFLEDNWAISQAISELEISGFGVFRWSKNDAEEEKSVAEELKRLQMDGIIISPCANTDVKFFEELATALPVMAIDTPFPDSGLPAVIHDYRACGREIVTSLRKAGRKKLLILQNDTGNQSTSEIAEEMCENFDSDELLLPLLPASDAAENGKYTMIKRIGKQVGKKIADGGYDALFCPYHETINRLYAEYLDDDIRKQVIPILIGINRPFWYSERLINAGAMIWERCPDALLKLALQRILNWDAGHQRTTGVKRVKLQRRK